MVGKHHRLVARRHHNHALVARRGGSTKHLSRAFRACNNPIVMNKAPPRGWRLLRYRSVCKTKSLILLPTALWRLLKLRSCSLWTSEFFIFPFLGKENSYTIYYNIYIIIYSIFYIVINCNLSLLYSPFRGPTTLSVCRLKNLNVQSEQVSKWATSGNLGTGKINA